MTEEPAALDYERVQALAATFLADIRAHYLSRPPHRDNVFEVLNALASVAGEIIRQTDGEARDFFERAYRQQLAMH